MRDIAFLFSGQGAQRQGMGKSLCECTVTAREVFGNMGGAIDKDLEELCFLTPQEELNKTENAQLATLVVDVAAMRALQERGIFAAHMTGFSLGEYAALVCAGAISKEDAARIVQKRAKYMSECAEGTMAAVLGISAAEVEAACNEVAGYVIAANYNCPGQTVVSGETQAVGALCELLRAKGAKTVPLSVSGGFHSKLMEPAAKKLRADLEEITYKPSMLTVFNATADVIREGETIPMLLEMQCMSPVYWEKSIHRLLELGTNTFIECGHGGVLKGLLKRICPDVPCYSVQDEATLDETVKAL